MSITIDPTDYIEAPEGAESLVFANSKQQAKFELGVCMAVYKWEELQTAVDNSWGGPQSGEKRDWISGIVIELFHEKIVDIAAIEETLLYAMLDEFDVEVDNDSALEIADLVVKIYRQIYLGDSTLVDELYAKWQQKQALRLVSAPVKVESDPENPSDDDSSEDEVSQVVPQLVEEDADMEVDQGPVVDDDGFELVQKKGRRRN